MTREETILSCIDRKGLGLEIGPSHRPVAPKSAGFRVEIVDWLSTEQLREKYKAHGVDISKIEDVDYVWTGQGYPELTGKRKHYDWIIASHVLEHVPNPIRFLEDCAEILKDDGVLSLAVPDKRFCFDRFRPASGIGAVIDAHVANRRHASPGAVAEFMLSAVSRNGEIAWTAESAGELRFLCSLEEAQNEMNAVLRGETRDVHCWCFTPASLRMMLRDLFDLKLIRLRETGFFGTEGHEFFISLGRTLPAGREPVDRLELCQAALAEG